MKKIFFAAVSILAVMMTTSCSNDDIIIESENRINDVNVSVSLSDFYQAYNFVDTKHNLDYQLAERFNSFKTSGMYIQTRTLIYDSDGQLVDILKTNTQNTNAVTESTKLGDGKFTFVTIVNFSYKNSKGNFESVHNLKETAKLTTAYLDMSWNDMKWSIMSYDSKVVTVTKTTDVTMQPTPVGSLAYLYFQNFQYESEATYPTMSDNGIRKLTVYSKNKAIGYMLNPDAVDKYVYKDPTDKDWWYFLSDQLLPSNFADGSWTFFQNNLISYFYVLDPNPTICFGYVLDGKETFDGYGEKAYTMETGKVYLAYWDYFQVGNPYFGVADNTHWNSYEAPQVSLSIPLEAKFDKKTMLKQY